MTETQLRMFVDSEKDRLSDVHRKNIESCRQDYKSALADLRRRHFRAEQDINKHLALELTKLDTARSLFLGVLAFRLNQAGN